MSPTSELPCGFYIRAPRADDQTVAGVPTPMLDSESPRWRRTRVAIADGQCVGIASLVLSPATDVYFCEITVASGYRRRGLGTRLYAAVYGLKDQPLPVVARAMSSQPLRRAFAESIGCSVLTHCPEPWVDPTSTPVQQWIEDQQLPAGYALQPMRDLLEARVEQAWARYFDWTHQPFGVVHSDRLAQTWASYRGGLDPDVSMLSIHEATGDIVALSLVSPDAWQGRTFIVSETVTKTQPDGDRLLCATVATSLRVLGDRGIRRIELEGHSTDAHSPALVRAIPPGGGDPMDILRLAPPR